MFSVVSFGVILTSFVGFWVFNKILDMDLVPAPKNYAGVSRFKWRNVMGSWLHAAIAACLGLIVRYRTPEYLEDLVQTYTQLGEITIAISVGYFIYDLTDLIRFKSYTSLWPVILHHILGGYFAGSFIYHQHLAGYAVYTIIAEINSIFLHGRQLLLMYGVPTDSALYKLNSAINIFTYVLFRLMPLVTLVPIALRDRHRTSAFSAYSLVIGSTVLLMINVALFYRLIKRDFLSPPTVKDKNENIRTSDDIMDR